MTDIIFRNYLRLLRAGCFDTDEAIEPMSAWKWGQVVELSALHHTMPLVTDGYRRCQDQFFLQMPERLAGHLEKTTAAAEQDYEETVQAVMRLHEQLTKQQCRPILIGALAYSASYLSPHHCHVDRPAFFFPYQTQGRKADDWADHAGKNFGYADKYVSTYDWQGIAVEHHHRLLYVNNQLRGHGLQALVEQELRESRTYYTVLNDCQMETLSPTLTLFSLLFHLSHTMLSHGIRMTDLLHLGVLLRQTGHRVDFVKVQSLAERLKMQRMLQLVAQLMVDLFMFDEDELPFASFDERLDTHDIVQDTLLNVRRTSHFMKHYPFESLSTVFSSFVRSITDVEE